MSFYLQTLTAVSVLTVAVHQMQNVNSVMMAGSSQNAETVCSQAVFKILHDFNIQQQAVWSIHMTMHSCI